MRLIVCVDDHGGMLFNKRRQSTDRRVIDKILEITKDSILRVNAYTKALFPDSEKIVEDEVCLQNVAEQQYCFVEDCDVSPYISVAEQIILFRWNRKYPADLYFPLALPDNGWKLIYSEDFKGYSHERITMEVYSR